LRGRALGVWAMVAVTVVALAVPALAHHTDQVDPDDTHGKLDLEQVAFDHEGAPTWRLATFSSWTVRSLWDRGTFIVQLDTKGDAAADFIAVVRSDGRRLVAALYRLRRDGREIEPTALRTDKNGSTALSLTIPLPDVSIGPNRTSYFWSVLSSFTGGLLCTRTCLDAIPDEWMIEQPLPGVTPPPTPSPTPTTSTTTTTTTTPIPTTTTTTTTTTTVALSG